VVGSPDREYLWILARAAAMSDQDYAAALAVATTNGFDVNRLAKTTHGAAAPGSQR